MDVPVEFEIRHDAPGLRRAVRALWNARNRHGMWSSMAVAVALTTAMLVTRELPWYLVVPLTAVILHAGFLAWHRGHVLSLLDAQLARMAAPVFRYRIDDAGLSESSSIGDMKMPWSAFAAVRDIDDYMFLMRSPLQTGQFVAFPRAQLPVEVRLALRTRVAG